MNDKAALKVNSLKRLLELIEDVNQDIAASQEIGSELMQKQYNYLKRKYTTEILELLAEYQLLLRLEVV